MWLSHHRAVTQDKKVSFPILKCFVLDDSHECYLSRAGPSFFSQKKQLWCYLTGTQSASGEISQVVQEKMSVMRSHLVLFLGFICFPLQFCLPQGFACSLNISGWCCPLLYCEQAIFHQEVKAVLCLRYWNCRYVCIFIWNKCSCFLALTVRNE